MGCCQQRDENKVLLNRSRKHTKSLSIDLRIDTIDQDSLIPTSTTNSLDINESQELNEKNLLAYIQTCNSKKKWEMIAPLITNQGEVKHPNVYISWTEKPKSIGCVAVIYLGLAVKKYTTQVSPYIEVFLPAIVAFLKSGSMDLRENSIFLLYNYVDFASEKGISKLLSLGIFNYLARWILSPKAELRRYTISLCCKLYKDRSQGKKSFIEANGGFYLMQLIGWNSTSDFLEELVKILEELIMNDGEPIEENVNATKDPLALDILKNVDLSTKSIQLRNSLEKIISLYSKDF